MTSAAASRVNSKTRRVRPFADSLRMSLMPVRTLVSTRCAARRSMASTLTWYGISLTTMRVVRPSVTISAWPRRRSVPRPVR